MAVANEWVTPIETKTTVKTKLTLTYQKRSQGSITPWTISNESSMTNVG